VLAALKGIGKNLLPVAARKGREALLKRMQRGNFCAALGELVGDKTQEIRWIWHT